MITYWSQSGHLFYNNKNIKGFFVGGSAAIAIALEKAIGTH